MCTTVTEEIKMASIHTLESCKASALKYQTRNEWKASDNPSYQAASRNKWVAECTPHMIVSKGGAKAGERNHTTAEYLALYHAVHGDRYDTSLVDYKDSVTKIKLICAEHGVFEQRPASSLNGRGCPKCGLAKQVAARTTSQVDFIDMCRNEHGSRYSYKNVVYKGVKSKVEIICKEHGTFKQIAGDHLGGVGCPHCNGGVAKSHSQFVTASVEKHGDKYDYSKVKYINSGVKVEIICPVHGAFFQQPATHVAGVGCNACAIDLRASTLRKSTEQFLTGLENRGYDYSEAKYVGKDNDIKIICPTHGVFYQNAGNHKYLGTGCPQCSHIGPSKAENEIFEYVKSICPDAEQSNRKLIAPKEIDIYVPSLNIAIEHNGLIHHSEAFKLPSVAKLYHQDKTYACNAIGIRLIHIWEDEWLNKPDIIKAYLRRVLGVSSRRINARDCSVLAVKSRVVKEFLNEHHLQGGDRGGDGFALYYKDELVAVAIASRVQGVTTHRELARWCVKSDVSVLGGFTKVLARFNEPLISFCDTAKHMGNGYGLAGWETQSTGDISFWYTNGKVRVNRQQFQKYKLLAKGATGNTERELAASLGFYRIWGCNQLKFAWEPK